MILLRLNCINRFNNDTDIDVREHVFHYGHVLIKAARVTIAQQNATGVRSVHTNFTFSFTLNNEIPRK